jgi:hypothetical protein
VLHGARFKSDFGIHFLDADRRGCWSDGSDAEATLRLMSEQSGSDSFSPFGNGSAQAPGEALTPTSAEVDVRSPSGVAEPAAEEDIGREESMATLPQAEFDDDLEPVETQAGDNPRGRADTRAAAGDSSEPGLDDDDLEPLEYGDDERVPDSVTISEPQQIDGQGRLDDDLEPLEYDGALPVEETGLTGRESQVETRQEREGLAEGADRDELETDGVDGARQVPEEGRQLSPESASLQAGSQVANKETSMSESGSLTPEVNSSEGSSGPPDQADVEQAEVARGESGEARDIDTDGVAISPALEQGSRERAWWDRFSPDQLQRQKENDQKARENARTFESRDPLVADLARQIDADRPGSVLFINRDLINPEDHLNRMTEFDIETDKAVIQVKAGERANKLGAQIEKSMSIADKPVIGYAPEVSPERLAFLESQGHRIFTDEATLIAYLKSL